MMLLVALTTALIITYVLYLSFKAKPKNLNGKQTVNPTTTKFSNKQVRHNSPTSTRVVSTMLVVLAALLGSSPWLVSARDLLVARALSPALLHAVRCR